MPTLLKEAKGSCFAWEEKLEPWLYGCAPCCKVHRDGHRARKSHRLQVLKVFRVSLLGQPHACIPPAEGGGRVVVPKEKAKEFLAKHDISLLVLMWQHHQ